DRRADVGDHAIVSHKKFIYLASGADILVVENYRRGVNAQAIQFAPKLFLNAGNERFSFGEKFAEAGESVTEVAGGRRGNAQWDLPTSGEVNSMRNDPVSSAAFACANLVGERLLARRKLRHRSHDY